MKTIVAALSFSCIVGATLPALAGFSSNEVFLPAVGRIGGQGGLQAYTTIWITNLTGAPETFTLQFLKQAQANPTPPSFSDTLSPGQTKVYENVVESKLGLSSALGAARVTSTGEVLVAERIYNQKPGDDLGATEGLFFAGVPKTFSISAGQSASIQGVNQGGSENFRYNFALVETGGGSPTVNVQVFDGAGVLLGQKAYPLMPYEQLQPNVAEIAPGFSSTNARITATVTGGSGSVLLAGAQVANESLDSSGFEMSFRDQLLGSGGGTAGVTSLNGLTGALTIAHGANTTVNVNGSTITIDAVSGSGTGLTAVSHDNSLTGSGTVVVPLAIANGQVVRSLNGLHDNVTLAAGSNVTVTPSGNTLTIAATGGGGLSAVAHDTTLQGDGTSGTPLGVEVPALWTGSGSYMLQLFNQGSGGGLYISAEDYGVSVQMTGSNSIGVYSAGEVSGVEGFATASNGTGTGVYGNGNHGPGVHGESSSGSGVRGDSTTGDGVFGTTTVTSGSYGVHGKAPSGGIGVFCTGDYGGTGAKSFVEPHPTDPTKEIKYVCLEGPESGTYFRGTARILNGSATIEIPDHFRMVTADQGLTVIAMPLRDPAVLVCVEKSLNGIVIKGSSDVEFDYMVNGIRKAFSDWQPVAENRDFVPHSTNPGEFIVGLPEESIRRLKTSGILNDDGTINRQTAHRLGWDTRPGWNANESAPPSSR